MPPPRLPIRRPGFRFEIRPYDFTCVAAVYAATIESRERISPWMGWMHDEYCMRDTEEFIAGAINSWKSETSFEFVIHDTQDGAVAGSCGLNQINRNDLVCNLGYFVRTSKTRLGAATQAVALLAGMAFGIVGLNRLEIRIAVGNDASRGVAEKAGAVYEGISRCRIRVREEVQDCHIYALIRPGLKAERTGHPHA